MSKYKSSCRQLRCWIILGGLCILVAIFISLTVYYSQDPKDPTFTLEHASVQGFNLTSDGHLTAFFDIVIKANNPSRKRRINYSGVQVAVFKDDQMLAEDALDDFSQGKRNVTVLRAEPIALNVSLDKEPLFNSRLETGIGYIIIDVFMASSIYNNAGNIVVSCKNVNVTTRYDNLIPSSPPIQANNDDCGVYIYSNDI